MEEELRALLRATTAITDLCGQRVDWGARAQRDPLPAIVLNVISGAEGFHMNGRDGLFKGRVQVDCYGETYADAKALGRAVRDLLHTYRGGGFELITEISRRDHHEGGTNEATRAFRDGADFNVSWRTG